MISTHPRLKAYCSEPLENIENYQDAVNDSEHMWDCHHRNEICLANQSRLDGGITTKEQLIADGMYYNRPACELIFLRRDVHRSLHFTGKSPWSKGKHFSEEYRRKLSESNSLKKKVEMKRKLDGFTKVFPSVSEAARWLRENGYPKAATFGISVCAHGRRATAYGATWRYL